MKHGGSLIQARRLAAKGRAAECKESPHVSIQPDERIKQRRNCGAKYLSMCIFRGKADQTAHGSMIKMFVTTGQAGTGK